jgi:6-phosphogluconolactonase (cycloisomerase 2 family)
MRRAWLSVWPALAITSALLGARLDAQFAYVANDIIGLGSVSGYMINPATGVLTAIASSPFPAGVEPISMAVDPSGRFAYVVNTAFPGSVSGYTIDPVTGALAAIAGSPFGAGVFFNSVAVHPSGKFLYVSDAGGNFGGDISTYTIDPVTGALSEIAGSPFHAGDGAISITVDPSGKFAYVANPGFDSVEGYTIDPTTGALTAIPGVPPFGPGFAAGARPISVAVDPGASSSTWQMPTAITSQHTRSIQAAGL